jgi:beta-N-acetylhexosaminidase
MGKSQLRHSVGQLLIVGLAGTELIPTERAWLRLLRPAGIILFRRNIESAAQTRRLLEEASELCSQPAFRFVDVEGGLVDRLRDVLLPMPSAQAVAQTGKERLMRKHGSLIGREVQALGFNATLAPVLDLGLPESAQVMRTRTAASDAEGVIRYAAAFLSGLDKEGIIGCGKHFPGLGGGTLDSHEATPRIERSFQNLWEHDLVPYQKLYRSLPIIMISHAAYPQTKGSLAPASVSSFWINDILRKRIGYRGLVLSDDMEMGGILKHMPIEEAAVAAISAGSDLVEICHSPELIFRAYEALLTRAEQSSSFAKLVEARATKVGAEKHKQLSTKKPATISQKGWKKLREDVQSFATEITAHVNGAKLS